MNLKKDQNQFTHTFLNDEYAFSSTDLNKKKNKINKKDD